MPELLAARLIMVCIFFVSSIGKISSFRTFANEILDYQLVSGKLAQLVAYVLPYIELAIGLFLLAGFLLTPTSMFAMFLLLIFTSAITINLIRGRRFSCHCFGSSSRAMIGPATLIRNLILVALAFWIFLSVPRTSSLNSLIVLWQSSIQQFTHLDSLAPLAATIILSLGILFLLGEIDAIFYENEQILT